jgi:hypothetical protein
VTALMSLPALAVDPPGNWTRHEDPPWAWYAPDGWIAAAGPNDLNISSPTGSKWVKYGFSAAPVDPTRTDAANAAAWFAYWRTQMRQTSINAFGGLYSKPLASDRYTAVGPIVQLPAQTLYRTRWRQRVTFAGVRPNAHRIRGEMVMDYSVSVYGDSGAESFQIRSAPKRTFDDSVGQLRLVQSLIFYCGGTC